MEPEPSAIRAQPFAEIRHFFRDDFCIPPHAPETPGIKVPKRLLRPGKFLLRKIQLG